VVFIVFILLFFFYLEIVNHFILLNNYQSIKFLSKDTILNVFLAIAVDNLGTAREITEKEEREKYKKEEEARLREEVV
jgi:hypothetical protein